jgi:hypothetical protein
VLLQVLDADPGSHELLSELLLPHLRTFVPDSSSRDRPPLLLHQCAGLVHVSAVRLMHPAVQSAPDA